LWGSGSSSCPFCKLFCTDRFISRLDLRLFARVVDGKYDSTGVSVKAKPPSGVQRYAKESDAVRTSKIAERQLQIEQRAQASAKRQKSPASKE
jgi:hypothetical protein